jgi:ribonucleotide monophosphatase NagD (HAD superfamily)
VVFVSNNPTRDPEEYAKKLSDLGVPTPPSDVINTVVTTTDWLAVNAPEATVFPVSEEPLKRALRGRGIRISEDPAEIDIVIASYDRHFEYRKLQIAFDAIRAGARLVATIRIASARFRAAGASLTQLPSPRRSRPAPVRAASSTSASPDP